MMVKHPPVKQENGRKARRIEISVDACAELKGQVYETISALRNVYQLTNRKEITYVDTYQGMREKCNAATPELLFAFGEPYSNLGRFLHRNPDWHKIVETTECKKFSEALGKDILPTQTAPIFEALDTMTHAIKKDVFKKLQASGQTTLSGKKIAHPEDIEIAIRPNKPVAGSVERNVIVEPIIKETLDELMPTWIKIVDANRVLCQAKKENHKKGSFITLLKQGQECKAIAAALLHKYAPDEASRLGAMPDIVSASFDLPSLATLRDSSHLFGHLTFPKHHEIWQRPEVQQAVRYTDLWPWARKPHMKEGAHDALRVAHRNAADRAAISYFMNDLSQRPEGPETLYMLVTHDAPLIDDFIKFMTGIGKHESRVRVEGKPQNTRWEKITEFKPVTEKEYRNRGLERVPSEQLPFCAIITGREFIAFVERQRERVLKKAPMTHELKAAVNTLDNQLELLESIVKRDKKASSIAKEGTFAERVRASTPSSSASRQ